MVARVREAGGYDELTPTALVVWMLAPLFSDLAQFHSIFELRER